MVRVGTGAYDSSFGFKPALFLGELPGTHSSHFEQLSAGMYDLQQPCVLGLSIWPSPKAVPERTQ